MRSPSTREVEDSYSAHFHSPTSGRDAGGSLEVEGLQMSSSYVHIPVLAREVSGLFAPLREGTVIDATVGGGGHALAILGENPRIRILGIDADEDAVAAATRALAPFQGRSAVVHARFDSMAALVDERGLQPVVGVLFDLGVSSYQLDTPERGFSFRRAGPLDMRMDRSQKLTAASVVNSLDVRHLASIIAANGEPVHAMRIARAIEAARPLETTTELAELVRSAIPARARRLGGHPATRVFQAIRVVVNGELDVLAAALQQASDLVAAGGRIAVISYHSGEDRIVKSFFASLSTGDCKCPAGLPCGCGAMSRATILTSRPIRPSAAEIETNPRSASARLRAVEMTDPVPVRSRG